MLAAVVIVAASWVLTIFDFGGGSTEADVSLWIYRVGIAGAATAALVRGFTVRSERGGWLAIGAGLAAWVIGDLYWSGASGDVLESYPWITDSLFFAFYAAALIGVSALARARFGTRTLSLDITVGLLGLATLWAWVSLSPALVGATDSDTVAAALAYPVLDLVLASAAAALAGGRLRSDRQMLLLCAGFLVTAVADTIYVIQTAQGDVAHTGVLDSLWMTGAVLIGAGPWARRSPVRRATKVDRAAEVMIPLGAAVTALFALVWDHFAQLETVVVVLATLTLAVALAHLGVLFRQRVLAEADLRRAGLRSAQALALAVDAKDKATDDHSSRVGAITHQIAGDLGLSNGRLERLAIAGRLHDVGKISIPQSILLKEGKLTDEEYETIKRHPVEGERIVEAAGLGDAATWIRHHHERWDGNGYPDGLRAEETPLESRILGAADALDAMTSDRPYRRAMPLERVREEFENGAGTQFDPRVAAIVLRMIDRMDGA